VCTTELGAVARLLPEFTKRNVNVIALSTDDVESHKKWIVDINEVNNVTVTYPIIGDENKKVAELYGMIAPNAPDTAQGKQTVRSVFVIDPSKKLRLSFTYPPSTGRNFDELLRVIDSLQLADSHKVATPVDWKHGQDVVILPTVKDDDAKALFPKGWKTVKPYMRVTPQPNI
jgi:alkyl hydroperoxide reductase subunit AhpC